MKMRKFIFALTLILSVILTAGCTLKSVRSIRVVSGIPSSLELDSVVDLHSIVIEVVVDGNVTQVIYGDTGGVSIIGLDTSTSGQKTAVVSYQGVSVSVSYLVVGSDSKVSTMLQLKALLDEPAFTVITLNEGVYDFGGTEPTKIARSVVLRASKAGTVTLKNVVVEIPNVAPTSIVELRNVEITNTLTKVPLTVSTKRSVDNNTLFSNLDRVVLNNVTIKGIGAVDPGIKLDGKTHFEMYNSKMVTPTQDDYFKYMMSTSSSKLVNVLLNLENNEFKCNFWYGLGSISQAIIRGNLFEGTIPVDTHLKDTAYAPIYNVGKQPVVFHASTNTTAGAPNAGQLRLVISNNTFKNVENVLRVYNLDLNTTLGISQDLVFTNNLTTNVNYLVNHSSKSYTKDVLSIVKDGLRTGSTYLNEVKGVIDKNTIITGNFGSTEMHTGTNYRFYKGLVYQEKGTTDVDNRYMYIGEYNSKFYLTKVVSGETKYYQLVTAYSADGLDTRTITLETNQDVINFLNANKQYFTN